MEERNNDNYGKHRKLHIVLAVIAIVMVALIGAFFVYTSNYYHVVDTDYETQYDINITENRKYIIFGNVDECDKALIFYPGGKVEDKAYGSLLSMTVAEGKFNNYGDNGLCVILVKMPFNLAVFNINGADSVIDKYTNIKHWYIGGHSLGGAMAASYASKNTDKIEGLILLGAYPTSAIDSSVPILAMYGSNDGIMNRDKYNKGFAMNPHMKEIIIAGGNHAGFGNYGEQAGDGIAEISSKNQWTITAAHIWDFCTD